MEFVQQGSTFTGQFLETNFWDKGTISNGVIQGNHINFDRSYGVIVQHLASDLSGSLREMSGPTTVRCSASVRCAEKSYRLAAGVGTILSHNLGEATGIGIKRLKHLARTLGCGSLQQLSVLHCPA